jgi:hypothetical protein
MLLAELVTMLMSAYAMIGALFAIAFLTRGITRVDPVAKGSTRGFKLIVFPGIVALWPVLLQRWIVSRRQPA